MGARGPGSRPAVGYFESFDNQMFPPEKGSWPRYCRGEIVPAHLLRRLKHRRIPPQCQNYLEALILLGLVDDADMDEIAESNPMHPTVAWLKARGAW